MLKLYAIALCLIDNGLVTDYQTICSNLYRSVYPLWAFFIILSTKFNAKDLITCYEKKCLFILFLFSWTIMYKPITSIIFFSFELNRSGKCCRFFTNSFFWHKYQSINKMWHEELLNLGSFFEPYLMQLWVHQTLCRAHLTWKAYWICGSFNGHGLFKGFIQVQLCFVLFCFYFIHLIFAIACMRWFLSRSFFHFSDYSANSVTFASYTKQMKYK